MSGAGADLRIESAGLNVYPFTRDYEIPHSALRKELQRLSRHHAAPRPADAAPGRLGRPECQWNVLPAGGDRVR